MADLQTDFDRIVGRLDSSPEVVKTAPTSFRVVGILGSGPTRTYVIQTYRDADGDVYHVVETISADPDENGRLILPPKVVEVLARQRDSVSAKLRSKIGKRLAEERAERGEVPGFMRKKKGGTK